jgi:cyanate lyase
MSSQSKKIELSDHQKKKIKELTNSSPQRGDKKATILAFYKDHKDMSINDISKKLGFAYAVVRYAIFSVDKNAAAKAKTLSKRVTTVHQSLNDDYKKPNTVDGFCPKCGTTVTAHVYAVELDGTSIKRKVIGACLKCKTSFSYFI